MRLAILAAAVLAATPQATPAHADALRRTIAPMTRADGDVCDLLRAQINDQCKRIARDGGAAVYQSGSKAAGIRRLVLAIDTGGDVLIGPAVDVLVDQLESTRPTLRSVAIDGRPGIVLDLVATWKRGKAAERARSLVGCAQVDATWKCSLVDVGACDASVGPDGSVTTSCGASTTLSVGAPRA
ncbi:MAG TPA: hypothetical protein VFK02_02805 [Kofleriaceae bacterium]|nr:hypothetical protein [Kofleriaceae bacterium]